MRSATVLAFVATLLLLTAGCSQKTDDGAVIRIGIATDVENWYLEQFPEGDSRFVWSQVYETLVRLTPDLKFVPGLALSWSSSDDGKTWEFQLRKNVVFHDGTPFTAEAVIFSYNPDSYGRKTVLRAIEKIESDGAHRVIFKLTRSMPLPYYLSHVAWPIMGPGSVDAKGQFVRPVGTGPFKFERQTEDQEITLVKNRDYWGDVPEIDKLEFKVVPDAISRVIALESGDLDMALNLAESETKRLQHKEGITIHRTVNTFTDFIQFNTRRKPFDDLRLRRAVAHAIDTEQLVETILEGVGKPAKGRPISPVMMYFDEDLNPYEYDPSKARGLIDQAGWKDTDGDGIAEKNGKPLRGILLVSENISTGSGGRTLVIAEAIQGALRKIGMHIQIKQLELGAALRAERDGKFDMLMRTGFYVWSSYPRHFYLHYSKNIYSHFSNQHFDRLIAEADAAIDPAIQRELYVELQRQTLELLPAFYLVHREKVVAAGPRVKGYRISAETPWLNLNGLHLTQ